MFEKLKNLWTPPTSGPPGPDNDENAESDGLAVVSTRSDEEILKRWTSRQVDGRRVDIFIPSGTVAPQSAVLFLHGHAGVLLNENPVFSRLFDQHNLLAVCPSGGPCWWLDVVCPAFDVDITPHRWLLDAIVPLIEQEFSIRCPQIALCGVSMGGQGALQLSYAHSGQFPVVAAIAPTVDFHQLYGHGLSLDQMFPDVETARQSTVVLRLHPLAWPRHQFFCCDPGDHDWFEGCSRLAMKLSSSGILHQRDLETSAGGHSWEYFDHMADRAMTHIRDSLRSVG